MFRHITFHFIIHLSALKAAEGITYTNNNYNSLFLEHSKLQNSFHFVNCNDQKSLDY